MLQPVLTRFTQVSRVNGGRMRSKVIEVADRPGRSSPLRLLRQRADLLLQGLGGLMPGLELVADLRWNPAYRRVGFDIFDHLDFGLAEFSISLQASSGGACRSLAALINLPRISASSRKGANPFMQASEPPEPGAGPRSNAEPAIGGNNGPRRSTIIGPDSGPFG
jgi:hypothetical protein